MRIQLTARSFVATRFGILALCCLLLTGLSAASSQSSSQAAEPLPVYTPDATADRADVPDAYKWDLTVLLPTDAAWDEALTRLAGELPRLTAFAGQLDDPAKMRDCLALYFRLHDETNHATLYANLRLNSTLSDDNLQAMQMRSQGLMDELMRTSSFIRTEVLNLSDEAMATAYAASDGPAEYQLYLDNLRRRRARVLPPEAERVLGLLGDNLWAEIDLNEIISSSENAFNGMMTDIPWPVVHDADGNEVQLTLANYGRFRISPDRAVRQEAVTAFMATLRQYEHALAAALSGQCQLDVNYARARNYDTALEAYLDKDDLEVAMYDNLVATVNDNLPALHDYVALRQKTLGIPDIHLYDLYVPFVPGVEMEVTFTEAMDILPKALAPLGEEYVSLLEEGLDPENGWIDVYPSNDKDSGASSSSVYGRHPFVKMNYQDSVDDMSTLAHEYGHALHSHLSMTNQPYHTHRYVMFLAEIASTCNEALLGDYLISHSENRAEKAALLVERLEGIRTTIFRQTLFAEFEREVHRFIEAGTPVTAALLNETYEGLIRRYYGPGFSIDANDCMEWAYIPHFYYKYYVYSYATGLSCGLAIADKVKREGEPAVRAYLEMLSSGCSAPPLELLASAGVDLTKPEAIEAAMRLFVETIAELEGLLE
ncbi:MAG: oligoendopeptidase F [bacterium]